MTTKNPINSASDTLLEALFEEYRAMYQLALFRLTALDRRVPVASGGIAVLLGAITVLPVEAQYAALLTLPIVLIWLLRTTINHARSFEDAIRRIEQLEQSINDQAGQDLIGFQSKHPSRGRTTGGRTGRETVITVFSLCLVILIMTIGFWFHQAETLSQDQLIGLITYTSVFLIYFIICMIGVWRYQYQPLSSSPHRRQP